MAIFSDDGDQPASQLETHARQRITGATDAAVLLLSCAFRSSSVARDPTRPHVHHAYAETLKRLAGVIDELAHVVSQNDPHDGPAAADVVSARHTDAIVEASRSVISAANSLSALTGRWGVTVSRTDANTATLVAERLVRRAR